MKSLYEWNWKCTRIPLLLMVIGLLMIPWGDPIFHATYQLLRKLPFSSLFSASVQFGSFPAIVGISAVIFHLDRARAHLLIYFVSALLLVTTVNSTLKQLAGRSRPEWSVSLSKNKHAELQEFNKINTQFNVPVSKTDHWFGPGFHRPYFMDRYASFPSGHAASAFVIAAFLTILYPKGRSLWLIAAACCALARVYGERHFLEDVIVGGSLGWMLSLWVFSWQWPLKLQSNIAACLAIPKDTTLVRAARKCVPPFIMRP